MTYGHKPQTLKDTQTIRNAAQRIIKRCPSETDSTEYRVANLARHIVRLSRAIEEAPDTARNALAATQTGEHPQS